MPARELREAVICEPVRTAVGRMGGMYRNVSVGTLAQAVLRGMVDRSGLDTAAIDDVIFGQGYTIAALRTPLRRNSPVSTG